MDHGIPRPLSSFRRNRRFEHLEPREMLAVDATESLVASNASDPDRSDHAAVASDSANSGSAVRTAPTSLLSIPIALSPEHRTFDGTGNNIDKPSLGSVGELLLRAAPAEYGDGIATPAGEERPSPREISNALVAQQEDAPANEQQLSAFIYAWGQFIDHDMDLTEPPASNRESFNIVVPSGDEFFDPEGTGTQVIRFTRSRYDESTGTGVDNPREQANQITSWIDGSMVYGSDQATADSLRTFSDGRLMTSSGSLPPTDANGSFLAGDVRANENIELTSMHTLFVREHNWWADRIRAADPTLSDEEIYQQARSIVIAEIQVITYNEFLPAMLGRNAISEYRGYDATVDPSIANEFSAASFRMHSLINEDVEFFGNDGRAVHEEIALREAFNNPDLLRETGADPILKYLASTTAQEMDLQVVDSLRNFLFGEPGQGGFDLASLNIQRGRDHGLADYNSVRAAYGLQPVESFADITSDEGLQQALADLYGSVDNIDLWVGGLAEEHVTGSTVGPLIQAIVADQFERLRDADRYWYRNAFSRQDAAQLERTTLADVIRRNTTVANLQDNVFFMRAAVSGQVYADANANGRRDRRELALSGVTVELLNDEGVVVASTVTDRLGRYRFTQFNETGDYQIRIVVPARYRSSQVVRDVLISRGGLALNGIDFGLLPAGLAASSNDDESRVNSAAVDQAFDIDGSTFGLDEDELTGLK